ncbi:hypothetical protein NL676_005885 [Syzygium grande]|nr:hypothetical protein NL676_005885 [Syzygium grande]
MSTNSPPTATQCFKRRTKNQNFRQKAKLGGGRKPEPCVEGSEFMKQRGESREGGGEKRGRKAGEEKMMGFLSSFPLRPEQQGKEKKETSGVYQTRILSYKAELLLC